MTDKTPPPVESLSYEECLTELESLVQALESGQGTLEDAIARFERGQALAQRCAELLEKAELRVRTLSGENLSPEKGEEA